MNRFNKESTEIVENDCTVYKFEARAPYEGFILVLVIVVIVVLLIWWLYTKIK